MSATKMLVRSSIFQPVTIGNMHLQHRLAMAPMTRSRADADGSPNELMATYYGQRASFGLLVTGGTQPSADGQGYLSTPGIHTIAHVEGWRRVADAVHARGGHLFIQLMHVGRTAHPDNTPHHRQPVAPSAIASGEKIFTAKGMQDTPIPRALSVAEIRDTVQDHVRAAELAVAAGADGVEIHGANGYLIHQFLGANSNVRTDAYGGAIDKRTRFALEVAASVADSIGPERTGLRLSPGIGLGGVDEGPESAELYRYLVSGLSEIGLAYLHLVHTGNETLLHDIRRLWPSALLVNRAGRELADIGVDIDAGLADIAPVARWAIANPDFPERLRIGAPLNEIDPNTLYAGGAAGYVDYPSLDEMTRKIA